MSETIEAYLCRLHNTCGSIGEQLEEIRVENDGSDLYRVLELESRGLDPFVSGSFMGLTELMKIESSSMSDPCFSNLLKEIYSSRSVDNISSILNDKGYALTESYTSEDSIYSIFTFVNKGRDSIKVAINNSDGGSIMRILSESNDLYKRIHENIESCSTGEVLRIVQRSEFRGYNIVKEEKYVSGVKVSSSYLKYSKEGKLILSCMKNNDLLCITKVTNKRGKEIKKTYQYDNEYRFIAYEITVDGNTCIVRMEYDENDYLSLFVLQNVIQQNI